MKKMLLALSTSLLAGTAYADSSLETFMKNSQTKLDLRYRFEGVEQEGFVEDAAANTLRTRLSFTSGSVSGLSMGLEFDDVRHLGSDDFNSTGNGNGAYPVVADPRGTDLNQWYAKYTTGSFTATGGRQRIVLDDQRFVGGVAWRQNEQTYDGVRLQAKTEIFAADYSYVAQVNRIFGPEGNGATINGDVHLLNGAWSITEGQKIVGFYYHMDFEDAASASNQTLGVRYQGSFDPFSITASYATQNETGDAPVEYSADYFLIEASAKVSSLTATAGYEILGSDSGIRAFQTPLATGHKFQGFADKFLGTPANGIEDAYIGAAMPIGPVKVALTYHDFKAAEGSAKYGTEWDLVVAYAVNEQLKTLIKFADYSADDYATDTQKIWFQVQLSL
ncbi:porin [Simiduia sp. 21SJ11W-1]|uniref:alginate export family protein n=1 Tax=Simiduia sp. 21SJ11W-1 TaxID=2909669 RepID=UPI00209DA228|nr:alginate export family protein [Simiduia sp. 21SJ11W-1]UTA47601.1 porin [Simiduia sp. 21SJ11W-1]